MRVGSAADNFALQAQQIHQQVTQARDIEALSRLTSGDIGGFLTYAQNKVKYLSPSDPTYQTWQNLISKSQSKAQDDLWAAKVKADPSQLEAFNQHLRDTLNSTTDIGQRASLINQISTVNHSIQARDMAKSDQTAMLQYIDATNAGKPSANADYAQYLRGKLSKTLDPRLQQVVLNQISNLQNRADKEAVVRATNARNNIINQFSAGKLQAADATSQLAAMLGKATTPAESANLQQAITQINTDDFAKKHTDIMAAYAKSGDGAKTINDLQQLVKTSPVGAAVADKISTLIDQIKVYEDRKASSAAAAGRAAAAAGNRAAQAAAQQTLAKDLGTADSTYQQLKTQIDNVIKNGGTPTKDQMDALHTAQSVLSGKFNAVAQQETTPAGMLTWTDRVTKVQGEVGTIEQNATTNALKGFDATPSQVSAFVKNASSDPSQRGDTLIAKINQLMGDRSAVPTVGGQRMVDAAIAALGKGVNDTIDSLLSGKANNLSQAERDTLNATYQKYVVASKKNNETPMNQAHWESAVRSGGPNVDPAVQGILSKTYGTVGSSNPTGGSSGLVEPLDAETLADRLSRNLSAAVNQDPRLKDATIGPNGFYGPSRVGGEISATGIGGPGLTSRVPGAFGDPVSAQPAAQPTPDFTGSPQSPDAQARNDLGAAQQQAAPPSSAQLGMTAQQAAAALPDPRNPMSPALPQGFNPYAVPDQPAPTDAPSSTPGFGAGLDFSGSPQSPDAQARNAAPQDPNAATPSTPGSFGAAPDPGAALAQPTPDFSGSPQSPDAQSRNAATPIDTAFQFLDQPMPVDLPSWSIPNLPAESPVLTDPFGASLDPGAAATPAPSDAPPVDFSAVLSQSAPAAFGGGGGTNF